MKNKLATFDIDETIELQPSLDETIKYKALKMTQLVEI